MCLVRGVLDLSRLVSSTFPSGSIRVEAMVAHEVLAGRRDLREHARDVLEGVDALRLRRARVVVAALGDPARVKRLELALGLEPRTC